MSYKLPKKKLGLSTKFLVDTCQGKSDCQSIIHNSENCKSNTSITWY